MQQHASRVIGDWIRFHNHQRPNQALNMKIRLPHLHWPRKLSRDCWVNTECSKKSELIQWLDTNGYSWVEFDVSRYKTPSYLTYEGSIYVDIPYEVSDPEYMRLHAQMEWQDGKMKDPDVVLWFLPLERVFEVEQNNDNEW